eukprot:246353-Prorocentrum_minimum.AAC.2
MSRIVSMTKLAADQADQAPARAREAEGDDERERGRRALLRLSGASPGDAHVLGEPPRLDYTLQEDIMENAFLSALSAHINYWFNADLAMFLLRTILKVPESRTGTLEEDAYPTTSLGEQVSV